MKEGKSWGPGSFLSARLAPFPSLDGSYVCMYLVLCTRLLFLLRFRRNLAMSTGQEREAFFAW